MGGRMSQDIGDKYTLNCSLPHNHPSPCCPSLSSAAVLSLKVCCRCWCKIFLILCHTESRSRGPSTSGTNSLIAWCEIAICDRRCSPLLLLLSANECLEGCGLLLGPVVVRSTSGLPLLLHASRQQVFDLAQDLRLRVPDSQHRRPEFCHRMSNELTAERGLIAGGCHNCPLTPNECIESLGLCMRPAIPQCLLAPLLLLSSSFLRQLGAFICILFAQQRRLALDLRDVPGLMTVMKNLIGCAGVVRCSEMDKGHDIGGKSMLATFYLIAIRFASTLRIPLLSCAEVWWMRALVEWWWLV